MCIRDRRGDEQAAGVARAAHRPAGPEARRGRGARDRGALEGDAAGGAGGVAAQGAGEAQPPGDRPDAQARRGVRGLAAAGPGGAVAG
eukprot:343815-Alexandrium_andersonii.AAC.1